MADRENLVSKARLCEQAERYAEMRQYMKQVAEMPKTLDDEERNLLAVAYKNEVAARRTAVKVLSGIQKQVEGSIRKHNITTTYRQKVEKELLDICEEVIGLLNRLIPTTAVPKCKVFLLKLKGDYNRYMAEVYDSNSENAEERKRVVTTADEAYSAALDIAKSKLDASHPIRLGLALNCSVFHYEIQRDMEKALTLAKESYGDSICALEKVNSDHYNDSVLIMQLLKDNLTQWTADLEEEL